MGLGDRKFLDQQAARRIEHLALTEGEFLITLEHQQIAQNLGDFERRAGLNLFGIFAVAADPGFRISSALSPGEGVLNFCFPFLFRYPAPPPPPHNFRLYTEYLPARSADATQA